MALKTKPMRQRSRQKTKTQTSLGLMSAPRSGAKIRMYRQGHGDCFLLAFPKKDGEAFYVLIDCGYKPGSNVDFGLHKIDDIVDNIKAATGNRLDLVVITHEHQDHVNGFWKSKDPYFADFDIGSAWFAWTESPSDELAIELRRRYHDQLLGLVGARNKLATAGENETARRIDELLSFELGVDNPQQFAAEAAKKKNNPDSSINKQGMKLIKDKAGKKNTKYLKPHREIRELSGVDGVRVYVLGPPHDADLISDEDPKGDEAFPGEGVASVSFMAAVTRVSSAADKDRPFSRRFAIPQSQAFADLEWNQFFVAHYGTKDKDTVGEKKREECSSNAAWRRIETDWLNAADQLALVLNKGINNTSLVLAFEFENSGKVLLFAGDAQRGNWKSWTSGSWKDNKDKDDEITVRDLLSRTVLYKVGHHGSHNATLNGTVDSDYPNLAWMGHGKYANEFTAMISAVKDWAYAVKPKPWRHPLPSIKQALLDKAEGRVFQTDTDAPERPATTVSAADWEDFMKRVVLDPAGLYFEYEVHDE